VSGPKPVAKLVAVRVLRGRSLSLPGKDGSAHYVAGDELELSADEAKQLIGDGFVEKSRPER
jgi:hypothetical protein